MREGETGCRITAAPAGGAGWMEGVGTEEDDFRKSGGREARNESLKQVRLPMCVCVWCVYVCGCVGVK